MDEGRGIAPFREVVVAQDIDRQTAFRILEEAQILAGVDVFDASVREYPTGALTAHIVGYLGPIGPDEEIRLRELGYNPAFDRIGYAGVEAYFEEQLAGRRGTQTWLIDVAGEPLQLVEEEQFTPGMSLQLTLDVDLQKAAQDALTRQINLVNADEGRVVTQQGVVIAMDPRNGEILAMVSWPSYDNTRFARAIDGEYYFQQFDDPLRPLVNHAISALYPPGSVWKMITSVGAVDEKVIAPTSRLFDPGSLVLPNAFAPRDQSLGQTFVCWDRAGHGEVDLLTAIAQSCDVYYYQIGGGNPDVSPAVLRTGGLGIIDLYRWATAFGIGSSLGVELPGELAGRMPERQWKRRNYGESWSTGDTYNAAFGQGYVTTTPLQLLVSIVPLINGGNVYQPRIARNLQDANGNIIERFDPQVVRSLAMPQGDELPVLFMQEDMLLHGENSLACRCESDSGFYDEEFCGSVDLSNYTAQFDRDPNLDDDITDIVRYRVHVPDGYRFNRGVCDLLEQEGVQREKHYIPPFTTMDTLSLMQQGMRRAVTEGTGARAALPYVNVGAKTGTAEYCDDIASSLNLCKPGAWPAHAWLVGYAPYEAPEVVVIAFVYNGGEGSLVAGPIVHDVLDAYFQIKTRRASAVN